MHAARSPSRSIHSVAALLITLLPHAAAQELTVDDIFVGDRFAERTPSIRWIDSGDAYVTLEPSTGPNGGTDLVRHDTRSGETRILAPAADLVPAGRSTPLAIEGWDLSDDRSQLLIYTESRRVWRRNTRGDYWLLDRSSRELRRLGRDAPPSSQMFAKLSPAGTHAAWVQGRDIWVEDLRTGATCNVTEGGGPRVISGTSDWVYEEELGVRDGFRFSPDGRWIAFFEFDTEGVREYPLVDNTSGLYPSVTWFAYPKTGEMNSACSILVVPTDGGPAVRMRLPGDPRENYVALMDWVDSERLVIQQLDRRQKECRIHVADRRTGDTRCVFTDRDDAWAEPMTRFIWVDGHEKLVWLSERDGWNHAYLVPLDGGPIEKLTHGAHDVVDIAWVAPGAESVYYIASPSDAARRYLYRIDRGSKEAVRTTPPDSLATHAYDIAPNGRFALHSTSSFSSPSAHTIVELPSHDEIRILESNEALRERLAESSRGEVEFFRVAIDDDVELDAWCMTPPGFDAAKKYPVVVYVYGEPAGQTVLDAWRGSRYLWHLMLTQRGYVVLSFDNRGTPAPRGREWRKSVYGRIGSLGPNDQAAALRKTLESRSYLDASRVGIWGWSGGGSSTLHAMFKFPDLYRAGISIAPVPNQRLYDTIYQERYMGLPSENVDGYREGSAIHFAQQLEGALLLVHGTGDDNCHYQGAEALVDELIRHGKSFEMMAYPNRSHAIREGVNTTRHLFTLLTSFLERNVPPGARSPE